ncbi:MAG TPA: hypothetical protein VF326_14645 [Anaerolineaceae bacterium]|jgi:hypothetical protein
MYNPDTELLFPSRIITSLRGMRGQEWSELIDQVGCLDTKSTGYIAFVLMMVRLSGCVPCNADSFRAMRGCTQCAHQTIRRTRGTDMDLIDQYQQIQNEVGVYLGPEDKKES